MTAIIKYDDNKNISVEYFSDTLIDAFIQSRFAASENTNKTYRNSLRQLVKYFAANRITEPSEDAINSFINNLRAAKKSDSTLRLYTTTTKLYFAWLERRGVCKNCAADVRLSIKKSPTHKKRALTNEQAKSLLKAVIGDSLIARRDRCIIALALQTGVRTVEISRANVGDLRDDGCGGFFFGVTGKGRTAADAEVRIAPQVADMIRSYLELRGNVGADEPLFISTSRNNSWTKNKYGVRLSEQSVGKLIKREMINVGIRSKDKNKDDKRITPHSTRHYAITQALRNKIDIRDVSQMARHSSLSITLIYAHDISVENRRAELSVAESLFGAA